MCYKQKQCKTKKVVAPIVITKKAPEESVSTPKEIGGRDSVDSPKADANIQQIL